jgi:hypothetical protein
MYILLGVVGMIVVLISFTGFIFGCGSNGVVMCPVKNRALATVISRSAMALGVSIPFLVMYFMFTSPAMRVESSAADQIGFGVALTMFMIISCVLGLFLAAGIMAFFGVLDLDEEKIPDGE